MIFSKVKNEHTGTIHYSRRMDSDLRNHEVSKIWKEKSDRAMMSINQN